MHVIDSVENMTWIPDEVKRTVEWAYWGNSEAQM